MNSELIAPLIKKAILGIFVLVIFTFGYDYYTFENDADSPLNTKKAEIVAMQTKIAGLQTKVKQAEEFYRTLENKKAELRRYAEQLSELKATVSESLDVPAFMKLIVTEAKKVGLGVVGLKPTKLTLHKYYAEQAFEMSFQGVFVQLLVFLDRMSHAQKIVRVDNFAMKPKSGNIGKFIELVGTVEIKSYYYINTPEDEIGKTPPGGASAPAGKAGAAPAAAATDPNMKKGAG
jgi:Tfp pilus assembly protein PilO